MLHPIISCIKKCHSNPIMIRFFFAKFDFEIMDSSSYSRGLSDNPVSAFKEIMTVLNLRAASSIPQRSALLLMVQQPRSVPPEEAFICFYSQVWTFEQKAARLERF